MPDSDEHFVWEGVHASFAEAGGEPDVFLSQRWLDHVTAGARDTLKDAQTGGFATLPTRIHDYVLPVVTALAAAQRKEGDCLAILDLGGGMAASYFQVAASLPGGAGSLDFHVVENQGICDRTNDVLGSPSGISFHSTMPERDSFDIVHAGSSLHYIDDWKGALSTMARYRPTYLVLADVPAGDIPTFASVQNYYGRRIPVWFWNIAELLEAVEKLGYRLIYKSLYLASIRNVRTPKPMQNFDENHRLEHNCQLIFIPAEERDI